MGIPVAVGELVGRVLAEDAHQVLALRGGARVEAGLRVDLGEADGRLAGGAALERGLRGVDPVGQLDHRPRRPRLAVRGRPVRERVERGVELDDGAARLAIPRGAPGRPGRRRRSPPPRAGRSATLGSALQSTLRARMRRPVLELDALAGHHARDRDAAGERRAGLLRGVGDREARPSPSRPRRRPSSEPGAVEVALVVHQLDRGGARVPRTRPGPDHPAAEERVVQPLVGEVVRHHLGDRRLEDEVDHRLVAAEHRLDLGPGRRVALPGVALALAQQLADVVVELLMAPVAVDVGLREAELPQVRLGPRVVDELARARCRRRRGSTGSGRRSTSAARAARSSSSSITRSSSRPST